MVMFFKVNETTRQQDNKLGDGNYAHRSWLIAHRSKLIIYFLFLIFCFKVLIKVFNDVQRY